MLVRFMALTFMAATLAACSDATEPPFDELPLRDALDADPAVIASMSSDAQTSLATRLHETQRMQSEAVSPVRQVGSDETLDDEAVKALVLSLDGTRETNQQEAFVTATLDFSSATPFLLAQPSGLSGNASGKVIELSQLEGADPASPTADAEAKALASEAGLIVADLAEQAHANRFVRVSGWPVGAVVAGRSVYVNASWLVAMASKPESKDVPVLTTPPLVPQKVQGNPYSPPATLSDCAFQVESDCMSCVNTLQCADSDLTDISNAAEACQFMIGDSRRTRALCAIVLFQAESLNECARQQNSSCVPPTTATSTAVTSVVDSFDVNGCEFVYDNCLQSAQEYQWSSTCSVAGATASPGRKALMLFGPLAWLIVMSRLGRRGIWKAK